ncbi:Leucine-rich repeat receptor-like protein kinase PXC2 [Cocos nucifera]|uniref:Leucine-rich repeat receptor-like protein kinase PXC2 n=1 Tax=Cocos nucifera TaxID=13894 RepID=A0A8K0IS75_COCNU|nr:Leucine-rich repeat receptor-like protein kinase PXC2 [Cocos nucifera]
MRNLLLYCVFFLVYFPLLATSGALNDDVLGLIVFKADLQDPASKLASWNEDDDDPCGWIGVKCSPRTNRVTELNLDGFSLSGKIGRGLLQLQSLRKLSLSGNNFSGSLNPNLSQLENLWSVDLSENNLSGPIPDVFFRECRSLRSISLANNDFSGEIPPSVGSCSTLAALNLSSNRLSGRLPSGLWSLYGLRSLDLSGNSLSGDIPMGINRLYNLRAIGLHGNRLSGRLPDDIGGCLLLKSLDLSGNLLTGDLPETMRNLSMCSYLSLGSNCISGEVPVWIGEMKSLETLDLSSNGFSGQIPDSIGKLQLVKRLDFSHNGLTGSLPESIGTCKSLSEVDFSHNSLTGNLPTWIFESGLQSISISGNKMSGSIRIPISTDETLKVLDLSSNGFSGGIPVDIRNIYGLQFLNLSWNLLSGSIPTSIGELKSMQVLDLSGNRLNGSILPEIGGAVSLNELRLQKNSLTGGIPTQIANCSSLTSLFDDSSHLYTGHSGIVVFVSVTVLRILSQNNLTGPIPPTLANLTNLQTIDLSHNRLTGTLPKQLSNLPHLISFNISHNLFSGDLPAGNFFDTIPPSSISDNPGLCGSVVNRSCRAVLPKPIVLNPNSSSRNRSSDSAFSPGNLRHKRIILSISTLIAIGAAAVIALGVITITVLNIRVRSSAASQSAAALALSDDYHSHSPGTEANSGKLVMFSGNDPDFSAGAHAILNKDCELGRGGYGTVYKTILGDGRPVAIKKLTVSSLVKSQEDFEREIRKLGKVRHPNLVALEGYYWTPSLQLLIYEFVSGGNLYRHLHESSASNLLSWQERFDIFLGIARSLAHLHRLNIIHYNLKSSNILIDGSGEAKVGDYGLAKLLPMLDRYVLSSKIQSALGYMAPEFACRTVKITEKCDVYGFGVLVLEIVTGRRPVEYMEDDVVVLCDVVKGALEEGRVEECVDGKLGGKFPVEEAVPVMKLGLICTSQVPSNRPDMPEVVKILQLIRCPQDSSEEELS